MYLTKEEREAVCSEWASGGRDVTDDDHSAHALLVTRLRTFNGFRSNGEFCDVEIECIDGFLEAHKCVLSVSNAFFKTLFTSKISSTHGKQKVDLKNFSRNTVNSLLDYIYNF